MVADRRVAGLILAGGASARMGQPKALLEYEGRSFVAAGVATLHAGGCVRVLVVDGAHRLEPDRLGLEDAELADSVALVHNAAWTLGPLSSLQVGLRRALELEPALAGVLVHPVERPRVTVATVTELLAAQAREPAALWQPTHIGRSGHPMLWPRDLFGPLLALDPAQHSARTLVRGSAAPLRRMLEVDDPGVLDNLDSPADLARLADSVT